MDTQKKTICAGYAISMIFFMLMLATGLVPFLITFIFFFLFSSIVFVTSID